MGEMIIGLSCVNCGGVVQRASGRGLGYGTEIRLSAPNQMGETVGIAAATFSVSRVSAQPEPMLLCDGCMGAAVKAVCESILSDMDAMAKDGVVQ